MRIFKHAAALFITAMVFAVPAHGAPIGAHKIRAQVTTGGHSITLTWTLSADDTTANCTASAGCAETVYRGNGSCTSATLTALSSGLVATSATFTDGAPTPGIICYGVTFTINGVESPKDTVTVTLQPFPPTATVGVGH